MDASTRHGLEDRMMRAPQLLLSNPNGWRMAGPGGFRGLPNGIIESYGGTGLFWYAQEAFGDFVLSIKWRIALPEENSRVILRASSVRNVNHPVYLHGYEK